MACGITVSRVYVDSQRDDRTVVRSTRREARSAEWASRNIGREKKTAASAYRFLNDGRRRFSKENIQKLESRLVAAKKKQHRRAGIHCSGNNFAYDDCVVLRNMRPHASGSRSGKARCPVKVILCWRCRRPIKLHSMLRIVLRGALSASAKIRKLLFVLP